MPVEKVVLPSGEKLMTERYINQDLGAPLDQVARLAAGPSFEWWGQRGESFGGVSVDIDVEFIMAIVCV